jgi:multiple stress resistance protein BhsA/MqsR-controlled colanic acid and biofilm protein A
VIGHISAGGASNLDDLVAALAQKADRAGAPAFHITSANGKNTFSGTAQLLK